MIRQSTIAMALSALLLASAGVQAQPQEHTIIDNAGKNGIIDVFVGGNVSGPDNGTVGLIQSHGGNCPQQVVNYSGVAINTDVHFHGNLNGAADPNAMGCGWGRAALSSLFNNNNNNNHLHPQSTPELIRIKGDGPARRHQLRPDDGGIRFQEDVILSALWAAILDPDVDRSELNEAASRTAQNILGLDTDFFTSQAERAKDYADQNAVIQGKQDEIRNTAIKREITSYFHDRALDIDGWTLLVADGYTDFSGMTISLQMKEHLAVLKTTYIGELFQSILGLAPYLPGDGIVPEGNFLDLGINLTIRRGNDLAEQISDLSAANPDDPQIAVLEAELAKLWQFDGIMGTDQASQDQLDANRAQLLAKLMPIAVDINAKHDTYTEASDRADWLRWAIDVANDPRTRGTFSDERIEEWEEELAELAPKVPALRDAYVTSIDRQGLLLTEVQFNEFQGPLWEWLADNGSDNPYTNTVLTQGLERYISNAQDQIRFIWGIDGAADLTMFFGSPIFGPLRAQVGSGPLAPFFPGLDASMGQIESYWDAHEKSDAFERSLHDTIIAIDQAVITIAVIIVPPSAPVLVPIGLALTAGEVGLAGYRLQVASDALEQAEGVVATGVGTSLAGLDYYTNWKDAELFSFVLTVGLAGLDFVGGVSELKMVFNRRAAIATSNMVPAHAEVFSRIARQENAIILMRPVNPSSTKRIADNWSTKPMGIKGKSSDWGPQQSTIPVDPRFSKMGNPDAPPASAHDLRVYENYNLKALGDPYEAFKDGKWVKMEAEPAIAIRISYQGPDGKMIDVLGDPPTRMPITADYDLFAVGFRQGPGEILPFNPLTGVISEREAGLLVKLNDGCEAAGYGGGKIAHHGAANRFANTLEAADFPITALTPDGMVYTVRNVQELRDIYKTYNGLGYQLDAMPGWGFDTMPSSGFNPPMSPGVPMGLGVGGRAAFDGGSPLGFNPDGTPTVELFAVVTQTDGQNAGVPAQQGPSGLSSLDDVPAGDDDDSGFSDEMPPMSDKDFMRHVFRMLGPQEFRKQFGKYFDPQTGAMVDQEPLEWDDESE